MPIDENGFLGSQIAEFEKEIYGKHGSIFDLCFSINQFAQWSKFQFEVPVDSQEKKAAACFFIRVINGFQATVILQQKGLSSEAVTVLRGAYEAFCLLKKVVEEEQFVSKLFRDNDLRRLKTLNWVINKKPKPSTVSADALKEAKQEVANLKERNISDNDRIVIENLHPQTYSFYRLFSSEAHPSISSVVRYLQQDSEGTPRIDWGPTDKDVEMTLIPACTIIFDSISLMCRMFIADMTPHMEHYREQIDAAHNLLKGECVED